MTATSISMPDTAAKTFVVDDYPRGLATNDQYRLFSEAPVPSPLPAWQSGVVARLAELERLPPNWDGEGALPVSRRHANRANAFLSRIMDPMSPAPEVAPLADGGVQLEWRLGGNTRLDFISDDEEPAGVLLVEQDGHLQTFPGQAGIDEASHHLGQLHSIEH